ncbi:MAG: valine--tRNA ligase [Rhodospirillales bacterium]|nr:valine--tRNA ligase [Rhodospirillales bacterium]MBT4627672.1 valine--tRNA ligase [Rhodospirillales bacterium]MBT5519254.1 valine--tRNA ligase [Rhodospirillales bacterium]MBT7777477.1 valine--tRNA ligase [Rhodospirillales bacterium]
MLEKSYQPDAVEQKHYDEWEKSGAFASGKRDNADPYTIVIPPPNVTGSLHMGHALNNTLQDILIRYQRMRGRDALWQPGTDHAGIATQMVVERQMAEEGLTRHDLGREKFIERVWNWKAESGGTITKQLRRLGASCDWERERFTMDEGLSEAVRKVFVDLFKKRLIYRDKRLVNWDPKLHTAISDLEVEQREDVGKLWYFKYPIEGEDGKFVTIATTRPETMLADTGIAVHPDDERYAKLVGKNCILPIVNRVIPIVADDYADPEKGSGAVKMTPAHDFNDFEVGRRHNLKLINILDHNACLNENVPEAYRGMDRFAARTKVVAEMESLGLFDKIEDNPMTIPYGDRSGVVIEPWLMDQWFVDAKTLAGPAITAVEQGRTKIVPKQWENTYYEWMRNIQPWCISRQIWWGHQIPAWFGPDGEIFVEMTEEEAYAAAREFFGHDDFTLERDPDVLDTWFSSALWPFSTLGWPEQTPELERYYPTDVLITGFDILFFWVARMMMMGLEFMGEVPFHTVYIHALVRDEHGQKMSKSKGNIIDPLALIDQYGADALRFTLTSQAAQGRDVKLSESRVEGNRNFCTKIWNAARFCEMNGCHPVAGFDPALPKLAVNRWIIGKLKEATDGTAQAIESYRYNDVADVLYHFTWGTFCDWYLELTKPILQNDEDGDDSEAKIETRATTAWVLDQLLHLLHPVMPYMTEELWQQLDSDRDYSLILGNWPELGDELVDTDANAQMDWLVRLITAIRTARAEMNVPAGAKLPLHYHGASDVTVANMGKHSDLIMRLARIESIEAVTEITEGAVQMVVDEATFVLPIAEVIDLSAEQARLEKEIAKLDSDIDKFTKKLGNEKFVAKAPPEVVETERERLNEANATREKVAEALGRIQAAM